MMIVCPPRRLEIARNSRIHAGWWKIMNHLQTVTIDRRALLENQFNARICTGALASYLEFETEEDLLHFVLIYGEYIAPPPSENKDIG